ncbi:hypothetical protein RintRC_0927 [Richelia intracellularis]|nr:hypothetical protein RintRC_0927 [Richelia intracellularis]
MVGVVELDKGIPERSVRVCIKIPALLNQGMISLNFQRFLNAFKP